MIGLARLTTHIDNLLFIKSLPYIFDHTFRIVEERLDILYICCSCYWGLIHMQAKISAELVLGTDYYR